MYKIAVIEDDTLLGQALVEMLTSHGYQAFAAESVTKARRLLERQPVDLLLIDRGLADGDGVELCRQRSGQEKLPAIFLTARDEEEDETAMRAGAVLGVAYEIEGYIARLNKVYPDLFIFLTGGDALKLAAKIKSRIFVDENLVLTGLNRILQENAKI